MPPIRRNWGSVCDVECMGVLTECSGVLQVSKQEFDAQRVNAELDEALDGRFSTTLKFVPTNTGQRLAARPVVTEDAVKLQQSVVVGNRLSEGRRGVGESGQAGSGLGDDQGVGKRHHRRSVHRPRPIWRSHPRLLWRRCVSVL